MLTIRKAADRGHFHHGWLETSHTFSFADYHDPKHMGFHALRVINEDFVEGGQGFPTHGHADMEIITYVLEGAVAHKDSLGTQSTIRPGEVQRMTAGTGVRHSEFNPSPTEKLHLLQIWLLPEKRGLPPSYEQKAFTDLDGRLRRVADRHGTDGALTIHQDVSLFAARLQKGQSVSHALGADRHAWLQVARGALTLNGQALSAGDGAAVSRESTLTIVGAPAAGEAAELLLFDLA